MTIKPLSDRVLIEPAEAEVKTAGGIIIPDSAKENHLRAKLWLQATEPKTKKWW